MSLLELELKKGLLLSEQKCAELNLEPIPKLFGTGFPLYKNKPDEYIYLGAMEKLHKIDLPKVCAKPEYRVVLENLKKDNNAEKRKPFYQKESVMYVHPDIVDYVLEVWLLCLHKKNLKRSIMDTTSARSDEIAVGDVSDEAEPAASTNSMQSDACISGHVVRPAQRLLFAFRADNIPFMRRPDEPYVFVTPVMNQYHKKWSNFKMTAKYKRAIEEMRRKYTEETVANFLVNKGERKLHGMYVHVDMLVDVMQYCINSKCTNIATSLAAYVSSKEFTQRMSTQDFRGEPDSDNLDTCTSIGIASFLTALPEETRSDAFSKWVELKSQQTKLAMAQLQYKKDRSKSIAAEKKDEDDDDDEVEEEAEDEPISSGTKRRKTQHST
jgi:hypothetical protein